MKLYLVVPICLALATPAFAAPETIVVRAQPHTALDRMAREAVAGELARAAASGDAPLVLVGEAKLGKPKDLPALFIQLQSARECGSAGCSTSVYLMQGSAWTVVLDSVGGQIKADSARHRGMRDLLVAGDGRWVWDGHAYRDTRAAAKVNLKPR